MAPGIPHKWSKISPRLACAFSLRLTSAVLRFDLDFDLNMEAEAVGELRGHEADGLTWFGFTAALFGGDLPMICKIEIELIPRILSV